MSLESIYAVKGPFRGIIITFGSKLDILELQATLTELTLSHPNYNHSIGNKKNIVIYYKYPHDVALILESCKYAGNWNIEVYQDNLTRNLHPEILYVETKFKTKLSQAVSGLNGKITGTTKNGFLVQFKSFKNTTIAHEELRKLFPTKFSHRNRTEESRESQNQLNATFTIPRNQTESPKQRGKAGITCKLERNLKVDSDNESWESYNSSQ